jgi:uncharacterized GH25 family protein
VKRIIVLLLLQALSFLCLSHEFWMEPARFFYQKGETAGIDLRAGENFTGERWSLKRHRIVRLEKHASDLVENISLPPDTSRRPQLSVALHSEGEHLLMMQSNNAYIELEADKFNAYLKEDGLDEIMDYRTTTNTLSQPSREHYQRNTKLLLSCGNVHTETYKKNTGMPLEIIALQNPYTTPVGSELQFQVLFENKPHAFALVKIWHKAEGRTFMQNVYTDKDGIITTRVSGEGSWMISCVKMKASTEKNIDWQSYWGSYVFGV